MRAQIGFASPLRTAEEHDGASIYIYEHVVHFGGFIGTRNKVCPFDEFARPLLQKAARTETTRREPPAIIGHRVVADIIREEYSSRIIANIILVAFDH